VGGEVKNAQFHEKKLIMKNHLYKAALTAALGLAGAVAAQAQYANNDLDLGFTSPNASSVGGVKYDYVIDLGQLLGASAQQISASTFIPFNADFYFTPDLSSAVAGGEAYAGIFGGKSGSAGDLFFSATSTPGTENYATMANAAGIPTGVTQGQIAQSSASSVFGDVSEAPGANGANPNSFAGYAASPLEAITTSEGTGGTVMDLEVYEASYNALTHSSTAFSDEGYVSILFGSNGSISGVAWDEVAVTAPVPEPATWSLYAIGGLLTLALRRRFSGKVA
jgi:hypothetical protein